jgi:hypothetical protein
MNLPSSAKLISVPLTAVALLLRLLCLPCLLLQLLVREPYGVVQSFSKVTQTACLQICQRCT